MPSRYALDIKCSGFDIITWTFERSDLRKGARKRRLLLHFDPKGKAIKKDSDMYKALDVLASRSKILGIFSDWPATVTYYANCMGSEVTGWFSGERQPPLVEAAQKLSFQYLSSRLKETGYGVFSCCAHSDTRNSSSIQRNSSSFGSNASCALGLEPALVGLPPPLDLLHPLGILGRVDAELVQPELDRP